MIKIRKIVLVAFMAACLGLARQAAAEVLVPMDLSQADHLKAYGLAYKVLKAGVNVEWLLNYRGGSFLFAENEQFIRYARLMGVSYELAGPGQVAEIHGRIERENMEVVLLEKAPKVAVYTPPNKSPWDDAVTMALAYAEVDYETIWDGEVMTGALEDYDWLHLHHEDFTGQYSKFYISYAGRDWYQEEVARNTEMAQRFKFAKVWQLKHAVARRIADYVEKGGFLFGMCLAGETLDIALAAQDIDIVPPQVDGDGLTANAQDRLDFSNCLAFENFLVQLNPTVNAFSSIDGHQVNNPGLRQPLGYFKLFNFSAKYDPVPSLLIQNHTDYIKDFFGQSTSGLDRNTSNGCFLGRD